MAGNNEKNNTTNNPNFGQSFNAHSTDDPQMETMVSRRRLAFRPPVPNNKKTPVISLTEKKDASTFSETKFPQSSQKGTVATNNANQNIIANEADKAKRISWTLQEQTVFYEALKLHGKDFESISKFMLKKKINKDKEQVKNYYVNAFKVWKSKALIEDADWANIPRDARELFVLINGCEWRKRLNGMPFEQQKFKQLILEGSVSFRPKGKKFIVSIKTPYCPTLLKYFPYGKRNTEIPAHLLVRLKPFRNCDREFVVLCEQNPFLLVQININDKIVNLFQLLKRKWALVTSRMVGLTEIPDKNVEIRLFIDENNQKIHNILVEEEQNSPTLSLQQLKKDFEPNKELEINNATTSGKSLNELKLDASFVKEVFEINEDKIRAGLTEDEVKNASMLQLYYLLGMKKELTFNYSISEPEPKLHSWRVFKSLVARDYDDLMAKSSGLNEINKSTNAPLEPVTTAVTYNSRHPKPSLETIGSACQTNTEECSSSRGVGIIERENLQFIKQLQQQNAQRRKPKRQIKLVPDKQRTFTSRISAPTPMVDQNTSIKGNAVKRFCIRDNVLYELADEPLAGSSTAYIMGGGATTLPSAQHSTIFQPQIRTDFSILQPMESSMPQIHVLPSTSATMPCRSQPSISTIDLGGELSMDSNTTISQFHPIILETPSKSLPEDVRTAYEQMLKENSVDYCRQFEQLANMHQEGSPIKVPPNQNEP